MRETLREILLTLRLILDTIITGAADAAEVIALVGGDNRTDFEVYRVGLSRLAIVMMLLPIPILLLGIFGFSMWISVAGLVWAFFTILLSLLAAPIALIIDAIWRRTAVGFGERYVRLTLHVLFAELSFALMLIIIPIDKRPELIPLLLLLAFIIFIGTRLFGGTSIFNGRAITFVASMIFITIVISLFLPRTAELARNSAKGIDNGIVTTLTMKPSNAEAGVAPSAPVLKEIVVTPEEGRNGVFIPAGSVAVTSWTPPIGTIITIDAQNSYQIIIGEGSGETRKAGPVGFWKWKTNGNPLGPIKVAMGQPGLLKIY
ncbi:MAG: hypothetical protein NUV83_00900 [Candidatus Wolfebacteria bacterium]|nr:hypothetical protein [Candidatus Wolfebacteria bacterium]